MIHEQRLVKILEIIEEKQAVSVRELQETLYFSAATIRRDLSELARRGLVERSFGGAVALTRVGRIAPQTSEVTEERADEIAVAAAKLIEDRSTVFLGASPAVQAMLPELTTMGGITVVTDGRILADRLCGAVSAVHCTGGRYNDSFDMFTGKQAAAFAALFRYDCAFFSCGAVSEEGTVESYCADRLPVMREVMRFSKRRVLLCPRKIIGRTAATVLAPLDAFDTIVSDAPELLKPLCKSEIIAVEP